jgi:hypothetical protein
MKIDFHAHAFPDAFFLKLQEYYPDEVVLWNDAQGHLIGFWVGTPLPAWDHGQRIDDMNAGRVDVEILSNPSMYIRVDEHSPELCRLVNDTADNRVLLHPTCHSQVHHARGSTCVPHPVARVFGKA